MASQPHIPANQIASGDTPKRPEPLADELAFNAKETDPLKVLSIEAIKLNLISFSFLGIDGLQEYVLYYTLIILIIINSLFSLLFSLINYQTLLPNWHAKTAQ